MAINPGSLWPTQTTAPDANYPYGSAKAASGPTATDGTPRDVNFVNDVWGFFQRILNAAGITPSGSAETVVASDYYDGLVKTLGLPDRGHLDGLILEQDSDAAHDIKVNLGECVDSTYAYHLVIGTVLTKQIDANWAAGDDAGGFPSGLTLTAGTFYYFFLIYNPTSGAVDAGFDSSLTAANLLSDASGYTAYRRIGAVHWNAAGTSISSFRQVGDVFVFQAPLTEQLNLSSVAGNFLQGSFDVFPPRVADAIWVSAEAPTLAGVFYYINGNGMPSAGNPGTSSLPSEAIHDAGYSSISDAKTSIVWKYVENIAAASVSTGRLNMAFNTNPASGTIDIYCHGWRDLRGKDA